MVSFLLRPRTLFLALGFVLLIAFPYLYKLPLISIVLSDLRNRQAAAFAIWLIILMGLNLLTGYSGQISLGHAAFVAVGAYIGAILMINAGMPVLAAVLLAGLLTGLIGLLIGIPALRLSGPYLAIATLALIIVLPQILKLDRNVLGLHHVISQWTGGVSGLEVSQPGVPVFLNRGLGMTVYQWLYYNCMAIAVIMTAMAWSLTRSRIGRAFIALRDSEIGAEQMGINVSLYKVAAFGLSALYGGVGGALYFRYQTAFVGPTSWDVLWSLTFLTMIVLGGLSSVTGTIFAAAIMTMRIDITNWIASGIGHFPAGGKLGIDESRGAIFGLLLILTIIFTPKGAAGSLAHLKEADISDKIARLLAKAKRLFRSKEAEAPGD